MRVNAEIAQESILPDSGISQGSLLGPVLFVLVADQIRHHIHPSTRMYQYADDTLLVQPIAAREDEDALQQSIDGVVRWASSAGLSINSDKTKINEFTRGRRVNINEYSCNNHIIPEVDYIRYLGITLDHKLSFNKHAAEVRDRTTRFMYAAVRLCKYIKNQMLCQRLYRIYVEPILLYAASIENCHRIATQTALGTPIRPHLPGYTPYRDRCAKLKILSVSQSQRIAQFNSIVMKRFAENQTYTENAAKILDTINQPDPSRRVPLPLVNPSNRRQHAMTPLGFLLNNLNATNIEYDSWVDSFYAMKRHLERNVLLYI